MSRSAGDCVTHRSIGSRRQPLSGPVRESLPCHVSVPHRTQQYGAVPSEDLHIRLTPVQESRRDRFA
jgi:hypothetical protein